MIGRIALMPAAAALALAGCRVGEPAGSDPGGEPDRDGTSVPEEGPPSSILRPEILPEASATPDLDPLEITIPFAEGGVTLGAEAERELAALLESPQLGKGWPVILRGHTDSAGTDEANLRTSRRRAEAVGEWLTEHGVAAGRITVIALGEQRPVAPNAHRDGTPDEEGRAKNRRVTVTVAPPENDGDDREAAADS